MKLLTNNCPNDPTDAEVLRVFESLKAMHHVTVTKLQRLRAAKAAILKEINSEVPFLDDVVADMDVVRNELLRRNMDAAASNGGE